MWRKKVKVGYFKTKIVKPPIINQKTLASTMSITNTKTTEKQTTDNNVIHLAQYPVIQPYGEFLNMTIAGDNPRLLSLFTIVTFPNDACMSGSGGFGTCYRYILKKNSCKLCLTYCAKNVKIVQILKEAIRKINRSQNTLQK